MRTPPAKFLPGIASIPLALLLAGCAGMTSTASPAPSTGLSIQGKVHGGQQPVVGAHVYLMAANTTGYGNLAVSTLVPTSTGNSDSIGGYVLTAADGTFSIFGDYTCSANTQLYIYVLGGNPGAGANSAVGLLAALGACPTGGSFATTVPYIFVNEVSTVVAAYAMAGFAVDATHVSSSGTTLAQTGIADAFLNAANMETVSTGTALATTPAGNGVVPQTTINTIANILAACINSTGPTSAHCSTLFTNAKSSGSTGTPPTDTATAAINIAHNPGSNVANLYNLTTPTGPFAPALTSQPNDFTLGINFSGGGLTGAGINGAYSIATDATGNVWFTNLNNSSVTKLSTTGDPESPPTGFIAGNQNSPNGIAIDLSGNAWVIDGGSDNLTEYTTVGAPISPLGGYTGGGLDVPQAIAIDGSGNEWAVNFTNGSGNPMGSVSKFSSGTADSPSAGYTGGGVNHPDALAIDASGNVWVANQLPGTGSISKFSNAGAVISTTPYTAGGIDDPYGLAIDHSGNVWVANFGNSTLSELNSSGAAVSSSPFTGGGLSSPYAIAIDGAGNVWVANSGAYSVSEFSNAGVALSPSTGFTGPTLDLPTAIAIDGSGNVWIANTDASTVTELIGAAVPTYLPLSAAIQNGAIGSRP